MQISEEVIRNVVAQVLAEVGKAPPVTRTGYTGRYGIFTDVERGRLGGPRCLRATHPAPPG
jgi:hypothetical protein